MVRLTITIEEVVGRINNPVNSDHEGHYFIHISSYPNEEPLFYDGAWRYLNRPAGSAQDLAGVRIYRNALTSKWRYLKRHTQDYFCTTLMTLVEARAERIRILQDLLWFANTKLQLDTTVNVLLTKALTYGIDVPALLTRGAPASAEESDDEEEEDEEETDAEIDNLAHDTVDEEVEGKGLTAEELEILTDDLHTARVADWEDGGERADFGFPESASDGVDYP